MRFGDFAYTVRSGDRADTRVELDGNWFEHCRFERCTLVFRGEQPFGYADCHFDACTFEINDRAEMMLSVIGRWLDDDAILGLVRRLRSVAPPRAN